MSGFRQEEKARNRNMLPALFAALLLTSGCATTPVLLDTNILSSDEIRTVEAARGLTFNAVRFEVLGGAAYNLFYSVLYRDGFEVRTSGPLKNMGRMTLQEAVSGYDRDRSGEYSSRQSRARISEIVRKGSVIGYALTNEEVDIDLWEEPPQTDPARVVILLNDQDLRIAD